MTSKKTASRKPAASRKKTSGVKPVGKKKSAASRREKNKNTQSDMPSQLKKIGIGLMILIAVCLTGAMVADLLIRQPSPPVPEKTAPRTTGSSLPADARKEPSSFQETPSTVSKQAREADHISPQSGLMEKNGRPVLYEVFEETVPSPRPGPGSRPAIESGDGLVEIALIIDDIGYDQNMAMALYALEPNISFSVLPRSPYGRAIAGKLRDRGAQIMLHLPMEPVQYPEVDPGPGALFTGMTPDELITRLQENLEDVPGAAGVNNHMGSRLTIEATQMYQIFTILKKRNLFFVDSVTARDSQCRAAARLLQVRFGERDVFLDNVQERSYITGQFTQLKEIAQKHGRAIGIGHPYPATLETLKIELPKIKGKFKIVPASRMVSIPG
jgi:polysaccharide deacetylase 2 family uncharacterized protein YibQ